MENEKTARQKARSNAGFDKEPPLEAISASAAGVLNRPAEYVAPKTTSARRFFNPEYWDTLANYSAKEMVLHRLQKTSADEFINLLEDLKQDIREKDYETAATNFANALYPSETKG